MKKFFEHIENIDISFGKWLATAWVIIILRMVLESFSGNGLDIYPLHAIFLHPPLFYFALLLTMGIFFYALTKESIIKIYKALLVGFSVILIPPIVDFVASGGKGDIRVQYFFSALPDLVKQYFTYLGSNFEAGATYGIRTQLTITMIAAGIYVFVKTRSKWKTAVGVIGSYSIIFFYGAIPAFIGSLAYLPKNPWSVGEVEILKLFIEPKSIFAEVYDPSRVLELFSIEMSLILLPLVFVQLFVFMRIWNREKFQEFIQNIRYLRLLFHFAALVIGIFLGLQIFDTSIDLSLYGILTLIAISIATISLWVFSLTINDRNDIAVDKISNPQRLLVRKIFTKDEFFNIGAVAFLVAVLAGLSVNYSTMVLVLAGLLLSVIYSDKPLRLKRFPIIAPGLIALGTATLTFTGFLLFSPSRTLFDFPINLFLLLIFVVILIINIKDIKDVKGDKPNGIYTIPTLFGLKRSKIIISILFFISFLLFPAILLVKELIIISVGFGALTALLINSKKVHEISIFVIYAIFLVIVGVLLF